MVLFENEHCVRCGAGYKWEQMTPTPEGNLFCPTCWQQMDAKREATRRCPVDGAEMDKRLVAEVVMVDACRACGGTWFDKGELKIIEKKAEEEGWGKGFLWGWVAG